MLFRRWLNVYSEPRGSRRKEAAAAIRNPKAASTLRPLNALTTLAAGLPRCGPAVLIAVAVGVSSCQQQPPGSPASPPANAAPAGRPQAGLPTIKLWVGSEELLAEVARSRTEVATGMMFRPNLAEHEAMLFVFDQPFRAAFWMKNTTVPLSVAYLDTEGAILEMHDLKPLDETAVEAASDRVRFALETKQGWFQRHNVGVSSLVVTERGPLPAVFPPRR